MDNLEKVDLIRERLNVSYSVANQALKECDGDVVSALIKLEDLEEENDGFTDDRIHVKGQNLIDKIKEMIKKGNVKKITVRNEQNEIMVEIPVTAGVVGLVLFPYIGILAGMAAMFKEYTLEIDRKEGQSEDKNASKDNNFE
jgi:NACalpha-BTF3-like transcription factor